MQTLSHRRCSVEKTADLGSCLAIHTRHASPQASRTVRHRCPMGADSPNGKRQRSNTRALLANTAALLAVFRRAAVRFYSLRERAQKRNSSQATALIRLMPRASSTGAPAHYPKQQRRVQPLDRSNWRSTAIGRSGLTLGPARIHPPRSRPKAIPGLSISAESTAAAAKVATIAAQNCH